MRYLSFLSVDKSIELLQIWMRNLERRYVKNICTNLIWQYLYVDDNKYGYVEVILQVSENEFIYRWLLGGEINDWNIIIVLYLTRLCMQVETWIKHDCLVPPVISRLILVNEDKGKYVAHARLWNIQ